MTNRLVFLETALPMEPVPALLPESEGLHFDKFNGKLHFYSHLLLCTVQANAKPSVLAAVKANAFLFVKNIQTKTTELRIKLYIVFSSFILETAVCQNNHCTQNSYVWLTIASDQLKVKG